jgi:copper chaperone CopZ
MTVAMNPIATKCLHCILEVAATVSGVRGVLWISIDMSEKVVVNRDVP